MDIIPSLAHPGAGECFYQEPLDGRGPFKMPLSVMENPQDDGRNAATGECLRTSPASGHKADH